VVSGIVDLFAENRELWLVLAVVLLLGLVVGVLIARSFGREEPKGLLTQAGAEPSSYLRGVNYILSNDTDAAIEELTRAAEIDTETVETYFALGALFRTKGEVERAIKIHQNLMSRPTLQERTRTQALFELGLDFKKAGLISRGIDTFEEVLSRQQTFVDAYRELQELYECTRDWEKAYMMQKQLAKRSGQSADNVLSHLMVEIGRNHEQGGDLKQARACFKKALSIDSSSVHAYVALGELAMRESEPKQAISYYQRAMQQNSYLSGILYPRLEEAHRQLGDFQRYETFLRQQVVQEESDVFARLALAHLLARQGKTSEAIEELRRALEQKPDFLEARKELGDILQDSGSVDELRREYRDLLAKVVRPIRSFQCRQCGFETPEMQWKCPQCQRWDTIGYKRFWRERRNRLRVA
jgi:lipopolysaccharide biosynthesis regulator YciM